MVIPVWEGERPNHLMKKERAPGSILLVAEQFIQFTQFVALEGVYQEYESEFFRQRPLAVADLFFWKSFERDWKISFIT